MFPVLQYFPAWFPGSGYKKHVPKWKENTQEMIDLPWNKGKELMVYSMLAVAISADKLTT
jgi:hypothetical protein